MKGVANLLLFHSYDCNKEVEQTDTERVQNFPTLKDSYANIKYKNCMFRC